MFIKTTDEETAKKLIACGYELLSVQGGVWTFANNQPKHEIDVDGKKVVFTNKLTF